MEAKPHVQQGPTLFALHCMSWERQWRLSATRSKAPPLPSMPCTLGKAAEAECCNGKALPSTPHELGKGAEAKCCMQQGPTPFPLHCSVQAGKGSGGQAPCVARPRPFPSALFELRKAVEAECHTQQGPDPSLCMGKENQQRPSTAHGKACPLSSERCGLGKAAEAEQHVQSCPAPFPPFTRAGRGRIWGTELYRHHCGTVSCRAPNEARPSSHNATYSTPPRNLGSICPCS